MARVGVIDYFEKIARLMTGESVTVTISGSTAYADLDRRTINLPDDVMNDRRFSPINQSVSVRELARQLDLNPDLFPTWLMVMLGYHEISHLLFTPKSFRLSSVGGIEADLTNFFEDRRIEHELAREFPFIEPKLAGMNMALLEAINIPSSYAGAVGIPELSDMLAESGMARLMVAHLLVGVECARVGIRPDLAKSIPWETKVVKRLGEMLDNYDSAKESIPFSQARADAKEILALLKLPPEQQKEPGEGKEGQEGEEGEEQEGQAGAGKSGESETGETKTGETKTGEKLRSQVDEKPETDTTEKGAGKSGAEEKESQGTDGAGEEETGAGEEGDPAEPEETGSKEPVIHRTHRKPGESMAAKHELVKQILEKELEGFEEELARAKLDPKVLRSGKENISTKKLIDQATVTKLAAQLNQIVKSLKSKKETVDYDGYQMDPENLVAVVHDRSQVSETKLYASSKSDRTDFHIVFAVDRSGSMRHGQHYGGTYIDRQEIANKTVANLAMACEKVGIATSIIYFTDECWMEKEPDEKVLTCKMGEEQANGENMIAKAVKLAHQHLDKKSKAGRQAIVVLTDGGDSTFDETADLMKKNQGREHYFVWVQSDDDFLKYMERRKGIRANGSVKIDNLQAVQGATVQLVKLFLQRTKTA